MTAHTARARDEPARRQTQPKLQSSPERVASSITKGVLRRDYAVGQHLTEAELTRRLKVGRSTVREALKILAGQGVVEIFPHRGAVIRGLSLVDARSLLSLLEVLTGLAARLAADNIDVGQNRKLFAAAAAPLIADRPTTELDRILDERARFYETMLDIADNSELRRAMPLPRAHLFRAQFYGFLSRPDLRAMVKEYRNIAKAILAGAGARAELYARRHLQNTAERTLPHLR
jgi:DNA-binding GntR family transcriptional regulator